MFHPATDIKRSICNWSSVDHYLLMINWSNNDSHAWNGNSSASLEDRGAYSRTYAGLAQKKDLISLINPDKLPDEPPGVAQNTIRKVLWEDLLTSDKTKDANTGPKQPVQWRHLVAKSIFYHPFWRFQHKVKKYYFLLCLGVFFKLYLGVSKFKQQEFGAADFVTFLLKSRLQKFGDEQPKIFSQLHKMCIKLHTCLICPWSPNF